MVRNIENNSKLLDMLNQEYDIHIQFLDTVELTPKQKNSFEELKALYLSDKKKIIEFLSHRTHRAIFPNASEIKNIEPKNHAYSLSSQEIKDTLSDGVLDPKPLPYVPESLINNLLKEATSLMNIVNNGSSQKFDYSFAVNFLMPSISELIKKNIDAIIQPFKSLMNLSEDEKVYLTTELIMVEPNKGSRYNLHNDYKLPSEWMKNPGPWLNMHLALTPISVNSAPLYLFPRTHTTIVSPSYIIEQIIENKIPAKEKEIHLFLKALAITQNGGLDKKIIINDREFNATDVYSPIIYKYYIENYSTSWKDIESIFMESKVGEYTLFLPSVFHYSFHKNTQETPRITLVFRPTIENTVYTEKLSSSDLISFFSKVFENTIYTQKFTIEEIINIILGVPINTEISSSMTTAMLVNPGKNEKNAVTLEGIERLNKAVGIC